MHICLTFLKLSKSSHAFKFRLTARQCLNWCKALTLGTKLATRATKWEIRGYRFSYLANNPFILSKTTVGYLYSSAQSKVRKSLSRASQIKKSPNWRFFGKMKIYEIEFYTKNQFG